MVDEAVSPPEEEELETTETLKKKIDDLIEEIEEVKNKGKGMNGGGEAKNASITVDELKKIDIKDLFKIHFKFAYLVFRIKISCFIGSTGFVKSLIGEEKAQPAPLPDVQMPDVQMLDVPIYPYDIETDDDLKKQCSNDIMKLLKNFETIKEQVRIINENYKTFMKKATQKSFNLAKMSPDVKQNKHLVIRLNEIEDVITDEKGETIIGKSFYTDNKFTIKLIGSKTDVELNPSKFSFLSYTPNNEPTKEILVPGNIYANISNDKKIAYTTESYSTITTSENFAVDSYLKFTYGPTGSGKTHFLKKCELLGVDDKKGIEYYSDENGKWDWGTEQIDHTERKTRATVKNYDSSRSHYYQKSNEVMDLAGLEEPFLMNDYLPKINLTEGEDWDIYSKKHDLNAEEKTQRFKERFLDGHLDFTIEKALEIYTSNNINNYLNTLVDAEEERNNIEDLLKLYIDIQDIIKDYKNTDKISLEKMHTEIFTENKYTVDSLKTYIEKTINNLKNQVVPELGNIEEIVGKLETTVREQIIKEMENEKFWDRDTFNLDKFKFTVTIPVNYTENKIDMTFEIDILKTDLRWEEFISQLKWYNKSLSYGDISRHDKLVLVNYIDFLKTEEPPATQDYAPGGTIFRDKLRKFDPGSSSYEWKYSEIKNDMEEILLKKNLSNAIKGAQDTLEEKFKMMIERRTAAEKLEEASKNNLKYCLLLILNYISRIFEGFHINKSLFELQNQLQSKNIEAPLIIPGNEKQNLALLDLFCHKYFTPRETTYYSPFIKEIKQALSDKTIIGILVLDIAKGETEKILEKEEYEAIISNSILDKFKYANTLSSMTVGIIPLIEAMKKIGGIEGYNKYKEPDEESSLTQKLHTMSAIEFMNSFYTGYKAPYFVEKNTLCDLKTLRSGAPVGTDWMAQVLECETEVVSGGKIINQNIRVKELSKLKKLYKELNKK